MQDRSNAAFFQEYHFTRVCKWAGVKPEPDNISMEDYYSWAAFMSAENEAQKLVAEHNKNR